MTGACKKIFNIEQPNNKSTSSTYEDEFFAAEKGKLTLFKTMEDLLSEMQDGNSTHTRNFHCIKLCVCGRRFSLQTGSFVLLSFCLVGMFFAPEY